MSTLRERTLEIVPAAGMSGRKFDERDSHGLTGVMSAVDFILESSDFTYYVEVKDPDDPSASPENRDKFLRKFSSNELTKSLVRKFRDTFIYELASGKVDKPIIYMVLICCKEIDDAGFLSLGDRLTAELPKHGPRGAEWPKPIVRDCLVVSCSKWNLIMPSFKLRRTAL